MRGVAVAAVVQWFLANSSGGIALRRWRTQPSPRHTNQTLRGAPHAAARCWAVDRFDILPRPGGSERPASLEEALINFLVRQDVPGISLLTMGEAWHNNHHAFPGSARLGLRTSQFDPGWWALIALRTLGLAWNLTTNKATLCVRGEDGNKARAEAAGPKDKPTVLNEIRIADVSKHSSAPVPPGDLFSGDIVEIVVWPYAMEWEERSGQEWNLMQHYFANPGTRY